MYFLYGAFPWQEHKAATNKQKYDHIMENKMTTPTDRFCQSFPNKSGIFLKYTYVLCFDNKPDYSYLCKVFHDPFIREGYQYDYNFNWWVQRAKDDCNTGTSALKVAASRCLYGPYSR